MDMRIKNLWRLHEFKSKLSLCKRQVVSLNVMRNIIRLTTVASCPIQQPSGVKQMTHYQAEQVNIHDKIFLEAFQNVF